MSEILCVVKRIVPRQPGANRVVGIFSVKEKAIEACKDEYYLINEYEINKNYDEAGVLDTPTPHYPRRKQ